MAKRKNPAAVALGKLGGKAKKRYPYGFSVASKEQLKEWSAKGVRTRKRKATARKRKSQANRS